MCRSEVQLIDAVSWQQTLIWTNKKEEEEKRNIWIKRETFSTLEPGTFLCDRMEITRSWNVRRKCHLVAKKDQSGTPRWLYHLSWYKRPKNIGSVRFAYRNGCNARARGLTLPSPFTLLCIWIYRLEAQRCDMQAPDCLFNLTKIRWKSNYQSVLFLFVYLSCERNGVLAWSSSRLWPVWPRWWRSSCQGG